MLCLFSAPIVERCSFHRSIIRYARNASLATVKVTANEDHQAESRHHGQSRRLAKHLLW